MHDEADDRLLNLVGAVGLAVATAQRQVTEKTLAFGGAAPAALVTIAAYPGKSVEQLGAVLGLTQPGATRLVDRLERAVLVSRRDGEGRRQALHTTSLGESAVSSLLDARHRALDRLLQPLDAADRAALTGILERLLAAWTGSRLDLEQLCR